MFERGHDLGRGAIAFSLGVTAVAAASAMVAASVEVSNGPEKATALAESERPVVNLATQIAIGGHTDSNSSFFVGLLEGTGRAGGDNVVPVEYPAQIAPLDQMTMVQSDQEGADAAYADYQAARARGEDVVITGFSQGADVATIVARRIADENGGVLPPGVRVVTFGNPDSSTGVYDSTVGQLIGPELQMIGLPTTNRLPAGSEEHSSQNDIYANSANQHALTQLAMLTDVGVGHRVAAPWEETLSWTDQYGVTHYRSDVGLHPWAQLAMANGLYVNQGYNDFLNAAFPVNPGNLAVPPAPDAPVAINALARAWDEQLGTGQLFQFMSLFVPAPLVQVGLDVANYGPDLGVQVAADVQNNVLNIPNVLQNTANGVIVDRLTQPQPTPVVSIPESSPVVQPINTTLQQQADTTKNLVESTINSFIPVIPGVPRQTVQLPEAPLGQPDQVQNPLAPLQNAVNGVVANLTNAAQNLVPATPQVAPVEAPAAPAPVAPIVESAPAVAPAAPAPAVEAPAPVIEAPAPAPAPAVEAPVPAPVVEAPAPAPAPAMPVEVPAPAPVQEVLQNVVDQVQQALPNVGDLTPAPGQ